jgi:hypothetical protein
VHDIEDLVGELAWVNVAAMCVVRDEGNVKRANVRDIRKTLEKVMLQTLVKQGQLVIVCNIPNLCSR